MRSSKPIKPTFFSAHAMLALAAVFLFPLKGLAQIPSSAAPAPSREAPTAENSIPAGEGEIPDEETVEEEPEIKADKAPPAPDTSSDEPKNFNSVRMQGLNKVTARISTLQAPLGAVTRFGNLEIIARKCWQSPADERPENAALLEIRELKPGEGPAEIFKGWMFSSSPALSALEHPMYDITVLECEELENAESD